MAVRSVFDILQIALSAAWRRRYLICVPMAALPVAGLGVGMIMPKDYEARMTILVQEPAKLNPFLNDLAIGPNVKDRMEGLKTLVHSEHILGDVVRGMKLAGDDPSPKAVEAAVRDLSANLFIQLSGGDTIEMKLKGRKPLGLGRILGEIGNRFVDHLLAPERSSIQSSGAFLDHEIAEKKKLLDQAEQNLADFKARNSDKLPELYSANVTRLAGLKQTLEEKRALLAGADGALEDLRARLADTNPVVGRIEESIVQVSGELALLRARYTEEHSEVQGALRRLRRLEDERKTMMEATRALAKSDLAQGELTPEELERLWNIAAGSNTAADKAPPLLVAQMGKLQEAQARKVGLRLEVEQIERSIKEIENSVGAYGEIDREQQVLNRAVVTAREIHDQLAKRFEMARLTGALGHFEAPERVKLIDPPTEPTSPTTPPAALFIVFGLVGGLVLGAGLATVAETLEGTLRRREQVEALLGVPLLSRIPAIPMAFAASGAAISHAP